ncbi:L-alanine exporter AlaE [Candidatus Woesearchaeota archaeon]|nr:L-alanine exporter AlaE [Candidatus Woesearchaeota archaeon]
MSKPSDLAHQNLEDVVVNHQYSDVEHLDLGDLVTIHDLNTITGGAYGWWREQAYKITKTKIGSGIIKKKLVDLIAFNTFQVPVYVIGVVIGGFISEPNIDWKKVQDGATSLALISPILGPTMGWYLDFFRKCFGIKPAYGGDSTKRDITRVDY